MVLYLGSFILEKSVLQKFVGFVFFLTKNLNFHTINLITKSHAYLIFTRPTKLSHIINGYTRTALPYLSVLYQWVAGSGSAVTYVRKKEKKKKVLKAQIHREPCLMSTNFTFHCPARSPKFAVFLSYSWSCSGEEKSQACGCGIYKSQEPSRAVQRKCWNKGCVWIAFSSSLAVGFGLLQEKDMHLWSPSATSIAAWIWMISFLLVF